MFFGISKASFRILIIFAAFFVGSPGFGGTENEASESEIYIALTSHERGFKKIKKYPDYRQELSELLINRAQQTCQAKGYLGLDGLPETEEVSPGDEYGDKEIFAWIPRVNHSNQTYRLYRESFEWEKPWNFRFNRKSHRKISIASSAAAMLLSPVMIPISIAAAPFVIPALAVGSVGVGIVSYYQESTVSPFEAKRRRNLGEEVEERSSSLAAFDKKVPHLKFTTLPCSHDPVKVNEFEIDPVAARSLLKL